MKGINEPFAPGRPVCVCVCVSNAIGVVFAFLFVFCLCVLFILFVMFVAGMHPQNKTPIRTSNLCCRLFLRARTGRPGAAAACAQEAW